MVKPSDLAGKANYYPFPISLIMIIEVISTYAHLIYDITFSGSIVLNEINLIFSQPIFTFPNNSPIPMDRYEKDPACQFVLLNDLKLARNNSDTRVSSCLFSTTNNKMLASVPAHFFSYGPCKSCPDLLLGRRREWQSALHHLRGSVSRLENHSSPQAVFMLRLLSLLSLLVRCQ